MTHQAGPSCPQDLVFTLPGDSLYGPLGGGRSLILAMIRNYNKNSVKAFLSPLDREPRQRHAASKKKEGQSACDGTG